MKDGHPKSFKDARVVAQIIQKFSPVKLFLSNTSQTGSLTSSQRTFLTARLVITEYKS